MEQYLAWVQDDVKPGMVKPMIGNDRVLEITDLFHFHGATHDVVMLRVFHMTLKGLALRWINKLPAGLVTTWDLLEKAFIRQYCPPFKTAKKLEIICNFKQEIDETLYHAWKRYNDLLFKCPQHDLNYQQKVHIFYTGLDIPTRRVLDSKGFIPLMTPTQALISIQVMAEHSHNWYDEATTRERINDSPNNIDTKKPKENIHAIQASFKNCEGAHLPMECPLKKEDKAVEQNKYMRSFEETIIKFCEDSITKQATDNEWIRKFIKNTDSNIRALKTTTKNLQEKTYQLTQTVLTNTGEKVKARTTMGKENVKEPVPRDLPVVQTYVPPKQFLGNPYRTRKIICVIGILEEIHEDKGDMNDGCDITVDDVESLRKILTPFIHTLLNLEPIVQPYMILGKVIREEEHDYDIPLQDHVMQPLTPQTVHIAPPDDDYVAPDTNPILNKLLNEFVEEFADNTRVSEKIDSNPVNDLKELLKTYDFETFIRKLLHQLSQSSHKTGKAKEEMKSHQQFSLQRNGIQGLLDSCLCGRKVLYRRNYKGYAITDVITSKILHLLHLNELCGCVPWKPSRDFTRPLRAPSGLKGLLHMLNATVIPTKGKGGCSIDTLQEVTLTELAKLFARLEFLRKIHEDEGDINDGCDITVDDVERLRKILTPSIHTLPNLEPIVQPYMPLRLVCNKAKVVREEEQDYDIPLQDHVMQPLTPQTVHITPPDDDYVAAATNPTLNKLLNEFGEEFADNTRVFEKIDSNPVNEGALKDI
ncbi:reverse transcriptase domain-containing protein [Tanacetum coccineum]